VVGLGPAAPVPRTDTRFHRVAVSTADGKRDGREVPSAGPLAQRIDQRHRSLAEVRRSAATLGHPSRSLWRRPPRASTSWPCCHRTRLIGATRAADHTPARWPPAHIPSPSLVMMWPGSESPAASQTAGKHPGAPELAEPAWVQPVGGLGLGPHAVEMNAVGASQEAGTPAHDEAQVMGAHT
jgi:hypothetical protein